MLSILTKTRRTLLGGAAAAALAAAFPAQSAPVYAGTFQINAGGGAPVVTTAGAATNVNLNAARTILDWSSFNVSPGEAANFYFDQRSWIALNRVTGSAISINGAINGFQAAAVAAGPSGGNVWFYSPLGVAFGPNARVNVAGLLATSAAVNQPAFLSPTNLNIPFSGTGGGGPVTVAAGAQLNGAFHVALIAPRVTTAAGSTFTGGPAGSVLYGAADSFEVQLFPQATDFTIFTFIVPNAAAGTAFGAGALSIAGQTTAGTIYLAAYSRAAVAATVINAPGLLTATSSIAEYGQVTITTGRNIILGQPGPGEDGPTANLIPGLTVGHAQIGEINADGNVNVILTGLDYDMGPLGNLNATKIRAGQGLVIGGATVTIPGGVSSGDAGVFARGASIVAGGPLTIPTITAAGDLFFGSRFNGVTFDSATSGGNLSILNMMTVSGNLLSSVGSLSVSSGGPINVTNVSGGAVNLSAASTVNIANLTGSSSVTVGSNGALTFGSVTGGTVTVNTASTVNAATLSGSAIDIGSVGALTVGSAVGSSVTFRSGSTVRIGTATASGDALVRAPNMELLTSFSAANLTIEGTTGSFNLGGTSEPGLTNAEFQRIRVTGALNLYAGLRTPTAAVPSPPYGDFEVRSLTVDPTRVPTLNLFANQNFDVRVFGPIDTVGVGAGLIRIGDPAVGSAWAPRTIKLMDPSDPIDITKIALNDPELANARSFEFYATGDILIGSQRFVDLVAGAPTDQIDLARGLPLGVAPTADEVNRLYLLGAKLTMAAGGRILTQNTSPSGQEVSIVLTGAGVPVGEPLLTLGRAQNAQVFASFVTPTGLSSGPPVSLSSRIVRLPGDTSSSSSIFVNGCALGVGCALSTPATQFRIESFEPAAAAVAAIDPPLLSPPPKLDDEDEDDEAVVTGAGNEEIWRRDR